MTQKQNNEKLDTRKKWYVMAAVASGIFLATLDGSIVNIALPVMERELHTEFAVIQWVVLGYLLTIVALMLSIGRLSDMFGKKPLYVTGFIIFTIGSGLCGISNGIEMLIAFRIFQALGAVMILALGAAIVTEAFPPSERGKALGINGLIVSLGAISGPTFGGLILGSLSWHWIFFVNLPIGLIGFLISLKYIPLDRPPGGQRFDFQGAVTLFVSLLSLLIGLTLGQQQGFNALPVLGLFAIFIIGLITFIILEKRSAEPMIDLGLFENSLFSINLITGFMTFVASAGTILLMPFFLENVLKMETRTAGLLLGTVPLTMGIIAPLAGSLSDRFGTRRLTLIGLVVLLIGYIAVSSLNESTPPLGYVLRFVPIGLGMGIFQSPNNSAIMGNAPPNRMGVASGLLSLTRTIGQTIGIAILGAMWAGWVSTLSGRGPSGDATAASPAVQVAALHNTILVMVFWISIAVLLAVWALWKGNRPAGDQGPLVSK
jgi:EmrB/QacA subfamily drug resistance transporter